MAADAANHGSGFESLLDRGAFDPAAMRGLADRIAGLHALAPTAPADAVSRRLAALTKSIAAEQAEELAVHRHELEARVRMGRWRLLTDREPADVLYDLALPLMELWRAGRIVEANILANRYADVAPQGASGWTLLPFFLSLHASAAGDAGFAAQVLRPAPPVLIAIGGLSATGKTTLSRMIGAHLGRPPGARILHSDVFRKRLAGVGPEVRLPPRHYTPQNDAETYEALFESADDHLACGTSVILDAVFMSRSERDVAEMIALKRRIPFSGIWLEAPERDRLARVNARAGDASDAGAQVVRAQSRRSVGDVGYWHRMRVNRPIEPIVAAARAILDRTRG